MSSAPAPDINPFEDDDDGENPFGAEVEVQTNSSTAYTYDARGMNRPFPTMHD